MNIFSTDTFLETLGETFFPERRRTIEVFQVGGQTLRLLVLDGHEIVRSAPFYDFPQALAAEPHVATKHLGYFPRAVVRVRPAAPNEPLAEGEQASPFIDWTQFPDRGSFERHMEARGGKTTEPAIKRRKLERALGPITFQFDDQRPEAFELCLRWKAAQYLASGYENLFAREACVKLFKRLRERGVLVVASLSAGNRIVAAHLGTLHAQRQTWWVPSYDVELARYSPGRLLLEALMQESQARKHLEFDFLIGNESYKYLYATHERVIGPVGTPALVERATIEARRFARRTLARHPAAKQLLVGLRDRLEKAARSAPWAERA